MLKFRGKKGGCIRPSVCPVTQQIRPKRTKWCAGLTKRKNLSWAVVVTPISSSTREAGRWISVSSRSARATRRIPVLKEKEKERVGGRTICGSA